jgi:hypothetical protein
MNLYKHLFKEGGLRLNSVPFYVLYEDRIYLAP